jgi:REP element-mobilizing transposase RayT
MTTITIRQRRGAIHRAHVPNIAPMFDQTNQGAINRAPTVGEMIRGFKARCTCLINKKRENQGCPVWQRNYYERVIRNDNELNQSREYIINNPLKWNDDDYNPAT